jgi:hypothetical protein
VTLAYLDPASGSLIASALVGGVAAAGVAAKQARARLTGGFGRKRKQETEFSADEATTTDAAGTADTAENDIVDVDEAAHADAAPVDAVTDKATTVGSDT